MSHCGAWCFCIDSREVQERSIGYALLLIPPQLFIMALITRYAGESIRFNALSFRRVPSSMLPLYIRELHAAPPPHKRHDRQPPLNKNVRQTPRLQKRTSDLHGQNTRQGSRRARAKAAKSQKRYTHPTSKKPAKKTNKHKNQNIQGKKCTRSQSK